MFMTPTMPEALLFEELSLNAHPALQTQFFDGWLLRFANGYSNRANSVNMLYPSTIDPLEKISECEKRYTAQGLCTVFKVVEPLCDLDPVLERNGYAATISTHVMSLDLASVNTVDHGCLITSGLSQEWIDAYLSLVPQADDVRTATIVQILGSVRNPVLCARVFEDGSVVACAEVVLERGYACLLNVVVKEAHRGVGHGRRICESVLTHARTQGAHTAHLQAESTNTTAINLYTTLGFTQRYSYWYRTSQ